MKINYGVQTATKRKSGRPKKTWLETIRNDLKIFNLVEEIILSRAEWREMIHLADPISLGHKAMLMMMMMPTY